MTKRSYDTFAFVSKKRLYLPEIYYGSLHRKKPISHTTVKILLVAKLGDRRKNIAFFLEAMTALKDNNIQIGLCGKMDTINPDYPHDTNNYNFSETFNHYKDIFGDKLIYHGLVPHVKMDDIYLSYDLFVLPSKFEAIGAVVLEAMAHSMPVILSNTVGAGDYIEEGKNGFTFKVGNALDLVEKVKFFISNTDILIEMGKRSYEIVKEQHRYKNQKLLQSHYTKLHNLLSL